MERNRTNAIAVISRRSRWSRWFALRSLPALIGLTLIGVFALWGCEQGDDNNRNQRTLTIGFSNDMIGEIRSCGCAAKDYGGLGRRATFLRAVVDTAGDFLLLDGGDFFSDKLNYGKEKADLTLKSLSYMDYHGVTLGEKDFTFGVDYVVDRVRAAELPVVVANLYDTRGDTLFFPAARTTVLESGLRVGIIGVMSSRIPLPPQAKNVKVSDPLAAVAKAVAEFGTDVDFIAVVAHMTRGEAIQIANKVTGVNLIVNGHQGKPMRRVRPFNGVYVLQVSEQGKYMGLAFATLTETYDIRTLTTRIAPLTKIYEDDAAIAKLFLSYDLQIAAKEQTDMPAALFEARARIKEPFAGAGACQPCHAAEHIQWQGTKHATAFHHIKDISREFDRDCTPCHVAGFYDNGGFENFAVTPELVDVQCESCHGNGFEHATDPTVKMPKRPASTCKRCHTVDQTPEFEFDAFWARIKH